MWLWLLLCCASTSDLPTARAERGDLRVTVEVEGELEARRSVDIVNPLEGWSELDFVVEAGTRVEEGDVLLRFKTEEVDKELGEAKAQLDVARTRVEQAEARLAIQLGEARARIVQADLDRQLAEFRQTDSKTVPRVERAAARIEAERAVITTAEADTQLAKVEGDARAEIEVLLLQVVRAERVIAKHEDWLSQAELLAPASGVVLVLKRWGRETFRAGHDVYQGSTILQLPNLDELDVQAWVHEVDAPKVLVDQAATVTLDADDDTVIDAVVSSVAPVVVPRGEQKVKQLGVEITLDETTPAMKPGMTVSVELVVGEVDDGLLLPSEAVFVDTEGTFVRTPDGARRPVVVLAEGEERVAIDGLEEGDEVLTVDPARWVPDEDTP